MKVSIFGCSLWLLLLGGMGMAQTIEITGTESDPIYLTLKQNGYTFVSNSVPASGVVLPGVPLLPTQVEYHFVAMPGTTLVVYPFGLSSIRVGDVASDFGQNGGYLYLESGSSVTIRSAIGEWEAFVGSGVVGAGNNISTPETRVYRGATRGLIQTLPLLAKMIDTTGSSSAPSHDALGLSFAAGATNDVGFQVIMPSDWSAGSNISLVVHYVNPDSTAGTVKWEARWRVVDATYLLGSWSSWAAFSTTINGHGGNKQGIVMFPEVDMGLAGSPVHGRMVDFQIRRVSSGGSADTYPNPSVLVAAVIHYNSDILGWRTSFTK